LIKPKLLTVSTIVWKLFETFTRTIYQFLLTYKQHLQQRQQSLAGKPQLMANFKAA